MMPKYCTYCQEYHEGNPCPGVPGRCENCADKDKRIAELEAANAKLEQLARNPAKECYVCDSRPHDCGCSPNVHNRAVDTVLADTPSEEVGER